MKKLRVLVLLNSDQLPPDSLEGYSDKEVHWFKAGYDVFTALASLGHEVQKLGLDDELSPLRDKLLSWKPNIVFNLVEEFRGLTLYDQNVVSYLELMRCPYTGCNPRGLIVGRDKALSKKLLHYHRIRIPEFVVFPVARKVRRKRLEFPLIVKPLIADASAGIAQASIVNNDEKLEERVRYIHEQFQSDAIIEQYIEGREIYLSVLGNYQLKTMPIWELRMDQLPEGAPRIATEKVKWDIDYAEKYGIALQPADKLPDEKVQAITRVGKRIYRILGLDGYGRLDFRLNAEGELYFLEANPNPDISSDEEFASSAEAGGIVYEELLQKILSLGLRRAARA